MAESRKPRPSAHHTSHAIWNAAQRPSPIVLRKSTGHAGEGVLRPGVRPGYHAPRDGIVPNVCRSSDDAGDDQREVAGRVLPPGGRLEAGLAELALQPRPAKLRAHLGAQLLAVREGNLEAERSHAND